MTEIPALTENKIKEGKRKMKERKSPGRVVYVFIV